MSLALNKPKLDNLAGDIWKSAERLRGKFKAYEYQGVILPIRVNHKLDHRFLAAFLASPMGQGQVLSSFTGASRQGLSHKELGLISIPLPPLKVQRDTVGRIQQQEVLIPIAIEVSDADRVGVFHLRREALRCSRRTSAPRRKCGDRQRRRVGEGCFGGEPIRRAALTRSTADVL